MDAKWTRARRAKAAKPDSSEKLSRERAILEAAEKLGPDSALRRLTDAARAEAWWDALPAMNIENMGREIVAAIKGAPPDVNPLLLAFVLDSVETARKGVEPAIGRAALRDALAAVVPPGRQGKPSSRIPFQVFYFTAFAPADVALLRSKGFDVSVPDDPKGSQKRQDEHARKFFLLTPGALRTAKAEGRRAARKLPDVPPTR